VKIESDLKVFDIKHRIARAWGLPADRQILVYSGQVLGDHELLDHLSARFKDDATLWIVARDVWMEVTSLDDCMNFWGDIVDIDSLRHQKCSFIFLIFFATFCSIHGTEDDNMKTALRWTWDPPKVSKAALQQVAHALKNEMGGERFPQVNWDLGSEYGCALMATSTSVERVSLQVAFSHVALDACLKKRHLSAKVLP
jgi:hypothetical protein